MDEALQCPNMNQIPDNADFSEAFKLDDAETKL